MTSEELKAAALIDKGRHKIVTVQSGLEFEVREPTVGDRGRYADALKGTQSDEGMAASDVIMELMRLTARCTYNPASGVRVFSDDEVGILTETRVADTLADAVQELMKEAKSESGKESGETPSSVDASSSEKP